MHILTETVVNTHKVRTLVKVERSLRIVVTIARTHKVMTLVKVKLEQMCSLTITVAHTHKVRKLVKIKRSLRRCAISLEPLPTHIN